MREQTHQKKPTKSPLKPVKIQKSGFVMFQPGPNDALSQNFMKLGLLVAEKNVDRQTDTQDSCFISIDLCHVGSGLVRVLQVHKEILWANNL